MNTRWRISLLVLAAIAIAGVVMYARCNREPTYQGKRLSVWLAELSELPDNQDDDGDCASEKRKNRERVAEAVREIGTNALPTILEMMRARDSTFKLRLIRLAEKQSVIKFHFKTAWDHQAKGISGLRALGSIAEPVMPALTELLEDGETGSSALEGLAAIGPRAVMPLINALTNKDAEVRWGAAIVLGSPCFVAEPVVLPALVEALKDENSRVRAYVAGTLGKRLKDFAVVVPALCETLRDSDAFVRNRTAHALGKFGVNAQSAVPSLLNAANANKRQCLQSVAYALAQIDSNTTLQLLMESLRDQDESVRRISAQLLGELGVQGKAALTALHKMAESDTSRRVRETAESSQNRILRLENQQSILKSSLP